MNSWQDFSSNEKNFILILVVILIVLAISMCIISSILVLGANKSSLTNYQMAPTKTVLILKNPEVKKSSTPVATPTAKATLTPSQTPTAKPLDNIWLVSKIEEGGIIIEKKAYDVAIFVNKNDPSKSIKGSCMDPGWPTPAIGTEYFLNQNQMLLPVKNNSTNNLQRFLEYK